MIVLYVFLVVFALPLLEILFAIITVELDMRADERRRKS